MKMRMIFKYLVATLILPAAVLFVSCDETDYMRYDDSNTGIYFTKDTLNYSFSVTPIEIKTYTYKIPVRILGCVSNEKRPIGYTINPDSTNAVEGVHFEIGEACIMPDSIDGYIPVTIFRDKLEGTYATGYTRYKLCLRLAENEFFSPELDGSKHERILRFDNAVDQPNWLHADGTKDWELDVLGVWHPYKYIKMVECFHAIKDILPETYNNMVAAYGEYLEKIPYGDPYQYRVVFTKYIYLPMFNFFHDPANKDMILNEYADFPFDFPDPYWDTKNMGKWHIYKYEKMMELFRAMETTAPDVYAEIVAICGTNLEYIHVKNTSTLSEYFKEFFYLPMYNFFNDEKNKENIMEMYEDFPFDFPNPNA